MLSISEPIIKKHCTHNLSGTCFSFSFLTLKLCPSTFSLPHAHLCFSSTSFVWHTLILEVFWNIKGESSYLVIAVLKQLMLTATLPGCFPRFFQKFISVSELWRNLKGSINAIPYASMSTGYIMHSRDKKEQKKMKIKQWMTQKKII